VFFSFGTAMNTNLGNNIKIKGFFKQTHDWLSIFKQNHTGRFAIGIPQFGQFWIILLLDGTNGTAVFLTKKKKIMKKMSVMQGM
jgi:hypothetical protein